MRHSPHCLWCSRWLTLGVAFLAVGFLLDAAPGATPIERVIEIDGNPQDDAAVGLDWCCLTDGTCAGDSRVKQITELSFDLCPDNPDPGACDGSKEVQSVFQQNTKDITEIGVPDGDWVHVTSSPPDKSDLVNGIVALLVDPEPNVDGGHDEILAFAGDRLAVEGTAQIGAWFFQNMISPRADGLFDGVHAEGDILVLAEFTNGGRVSNLSVCEWKNVNEEPTCEDVTNNPNADAASNVGNNVDTCWQYRTKKASFPAGKYPENAFFSGAINLTGLYRDGFLQKAPGCLSSFMIETRTSHEISAVLKDFILGEFDTCNDISGVKEVVEDTAPPNLPTCKEGVPTAGWEIRLLDADGNEVKFDGNGLPLDNPVCTDENGEYLFENLPRNVTYQVCEVLPDRREAPPFPEPENFFWDVCLPDPNVVLIGDLVPEDLGADCFFSEPGGEERCWPPFVLTDDEIRDFRNFPRVIVADVTGRKFCDENGDGHKDPGDYSEGMEGFCIVLAEENGTKHYKATDVTGQYAFRDVPSGQTVTVSEILDGDECVANGVPALDHSAVWVRTTPESLSIKIPAGVSEVDVTPIGNTSRPTIDCNARQCSDGSGWCETSDDCDGAATCDKVTDVTIDNDEGECEADFCFTPEADNLCGDVTVTCEANNGVTLTNTDGMWCGTFPGPEDGACIGTTTVTCTAETEANKNVPEDLTATCSFDVNVEDVEKPEITMCDISAVACEDDASAVDENCVGSVAFSAEITDNCCVDLGSVTCDAIGTNLTTSIAKCTPTKDPDTGIVTVEGRANVSDLSVCPASLKITVDAKDCCGNSADQCEANANINIRLVVDPVVEP